MLPSLRHLSLKTLNRELYRAEVACIGLRIEAKSVNIVRSKIADHILKIPRLPSVLEDPKNDSSKRLLLLKTDSLLNADFAHDSFPHTVTLDYDYWTADEILSATLPEGMDITTAFETVGHIAHMNLKPEHMPYKSLIGQVILDKNPRIKSVVTKVGEIESEFRVFPMELIAGENDMIAELKEENCIFRFDFSKVYWNSRLQQEHKRLVQKFKKGEHVCDVFAGIGPFSIPAAKKGCVVYANDLNPESVKFLSENKSRNKIKSENLHIFNMDGREFITKSLAELNKSSLEFKTFDHYFMNLPALAVTFLDAFSNLNLPEEKASFTIHCYLFVKNEDPIEVVKQNLKTDVLIDAEAHNVRSVAPNKDMYCVSFKLPPSFYASGSKRLKLDENK